MVKNKPDPVTMYTDGSCAPINPHGFTGCGILIFHNSGTYKASKFLGVGVGFDSRSAEYAGLEMGLETLLSLGLQDEAIVVCVDLLLIFRHLYGEEIPEKKLYYYKHYRGVKKLLTKFNDIQFKQVKSSQNLADPVSKQSLRPYARTAKWRKMIQKEKEKPQKQSKRSSARRKRWNENDY